MNKTEKFWDRLAKKYDKSDEIDEVKEYKSVEYINQHLKASDMILDFGCATGTMASLLAGKVKEVHGIDISNKMIEIAKERARERNIENVVFTQASLFDHNLKTESYNMVLTFSVLHLLKDPDKIMKRIYALLKPGGLFISLTPCLGEKIFMRILLLLIYKIGILPHINCFKCDELEKRITQSHFKILKSIGLDNNPLEYFIIAKK